MKESSQPTSGITSGGEGERDCGGDVGGDESCRLLLTGGNSVGLSSKHQFCKGRFKFLPFSSFTYLMNLPELNPRIFIFKPNSVGFLHPTVVFDLLWK
jgi:hypothetical protein